MSSLCKVIHCPEDTAAARSPAMAWARKVTASSCRLQILSYSTKKHITRHALCCAGTPSYCCPCSRPSSAVVMLHCCLWHCDSSGYHVHVKLFKLENFMLLVTLRQHDQVCQWLRRNWGLTCIHRLKNGNLHGHFYVYMAGN